VFHPQNSLYSPNNSANRTPDYGADRAGTSVALIDTMGDTTRYSLSVRNQRDHECSNNHACNQDMRLH
jgi:hypothetical protein